MEQALPQFKDNGDDRRQGRENRPEVRSKDGYLSSNEDQLASSNADHSPGPESK